MFFQLLLEWKLRNSVNSSVLHIADNTEEALGVHRPTNNDGRIVREAVLSIKAA